ncbi:hypothetical protein F5B22DRAFT_256939 [Xylaria bambusicola]|uniref:uncharacterized protein n=1 Tax=Xylaria bambusicola TaxID=326684 RepID=UPI0020075D8B|nr:uncharacterized protein F5B22DRAFT_256939 [Xylaria bambusicola]KAI0525860.1 hypothetical protein F5B22DRAFT_256939 [Xylaria bambusicola]
MTITSNSTPDTGYRKPKTRQRIHKEPPELAVPNINDDAAERKRVLNVLAQRRYRERKRQDKSGTTTANLTSQSNPQDNASSSVARKDASISESHVSEQDISISAYLDLLPIPGSVCSSNEYTSNVASPTTWSAAPFGPSVPSTLPGIEQSYLNMTGPSISSLEGEASLNATEATSFNFPDTINPSALIDSSSNSPSASDNTDITDVSFPDSYYLPVNELTLLRGLMRIAIRLRCNTTNIWDLGANSPFNDGTHTPLTTQELPLTWRPTRSQSSIPHHPVIDLLPWPSVRDRILLFMGLPDEARPPALAGPLAHAKLAYDLEDSAEGIRIWGDDPCEPSSWEVGQVLFERWWFIFDRQIIDQSNYWRRLRGAATLCVKG